MQAKKPWLVIILATVVIIIAGGGLMGWRLYQRQPLSLDTTDFTVKRTSSGGLNGQGDGRDIMISGAQLGPHQRQPLISAINQADFFALNDRYDNNCRDAYITSLSITAARRSKTVQFSNCSKSTPASLKALDTYLVDLPQ